MKKTTLLIYFVLFQFNLYGTEIKNNDSTLGIVEKLSFVQRYLDTISVPYTIEESMDGGKTWKIQRYCRLTWDRKCEKYYFSYCAADSDRNGKYELREYFAKDGKWTIFFSKQASSLFLKDAVSHEKKVQSITICKEQELPFFFPMTYLFKQDGKPLTFKEKGIKILLKNTESLKIVTENKLKPNGITFRDSFLFHPVSGHFIKKVTEAIDNDGIPYRKLNEISVPRGKHRNLNGILFPSVIIAENFENNKSISMSRCVFSEAIELNRDIPASVFEPHFPLGAYVGNEFTNKTYIVIEKDSSSQEERTIGKLDALFEKANK